MCSPAHSVGKWVSDNDNDDNKPSVISTVPTIPGGAHNSRICQQVHNVSDTPGDRPFGDYAKQAAGLHTQQYCACCRDITHPREPLSGFGRKCNPAHCWWHTCIHQHDVYTTMVSQQYMIDNNGCCTTVCCVGCFLRGYCCNMTINERFVQKQAGAQTALPLSNARRRIRCSKYNAGRCRRASPIQMVAQCVVVVVVLIFSNNKTL